MKNLRKTHPLLKSFREQTRQPAAGWTELAGQDRLDLALQFILLPLLEANKELTRELIDQTLPVAVDLERAASSLLAEGGLKFATIRELLTATAGLFLGGAEAEDFG